MMIGSKMAFWMHPGCLGDHLGAQNMGRGFPTCEQQAEPTPKLGSRETKIKVPGCPGGSQAPQGSQADSREAAWESPRQPKWKPREPRAPQKLLKWCQNGVKMESKTGPKWDLIRSNQKCRVSIDFLFFLIESA